MNEEKRDSKIEYPKIELVGEKVFYHCGNIFKGTEEAEKVMAPGIVKKEAYLKDSDTFTLEVHFPGFLKYKEYGVKKNMTLRLNQVELEGGRKLL